MKYPKGAIKTETALKALVKKGPVFMVEWDDSEKPTKIEITKIKSRPSKQDIGYRPSRKFLMEYVELETGYESSYWIFKGEGRVPGSDPEDTGEEDNDCCFIFTKFWMAYAYWLKTRAK